MIQDLSGETNGRLNVNPLTALATLFQISMLLFWIYLSNGESILQKSVLAIEGIKKKEKRERKGSCLSLDPRRATKVI